LIIMRGTTSMTEGTKMTLEEIKEKAKKAISEQTFTSSGYGGPSYQAWSAVIDVSSALRDLIDYIDDKEH